MKHYLLLMTVLIAITAPVKKAVAQGDDARSHCVQVSSRGYGTNAHVTLRNSCPSKIYAYWVVRNPSPGEYKTGNSPIDGGETFDTVVSPERSVHVYACAYPKMPRDPQGRALQEADSEYICR